MATTVTYKGTTLTTVDDETKTLATAGKYMEGDVILTDTPSGVSNVVVGTFTTPSSGGIARVQIPYSGNGYPIALLVFPSSSTGGHWSSAALNEYFIYSAIKAYPGTPSTFSGSNDAQNGAINSWTYRNNTNPDYGPVSGSGNNKSYFDSSTEAVDWAGVVVRMTSKTTLTAATKTSSSRYGLLANTEHTYVILYSE